MQKRGSSEKLLSFKKIVEIVSEASRISPETMKTPGRQRRRVAARYVAIYLARAYAGMSINWVAKFLGYADHTTAVYARKRVESALKTTGGPITVMIRDIHDKAMLEIRAALDKQG